MYSSDIPQFVLSSIKMKHHNRHFTQSEVYWPLPGHRVPTPCAKERGHLCKVSKSGNIFVDSIRNYGDRNLNEIQMGFQTK